MRIWIIGGWAAGMMCAASLIDHAQQLKQPEIHLFEKNSRLGAKVIISGWGRCNVTTWIVDKKALLTKYIRGGEFLKQSLGVFGPAKLMQWFENHGVPLKIEEDMRVFPVSDNGKDVVGAFENLFATSNVHVHLKCGITEVQPLHPWFRLTTSEGVYDVDCVVITTWGEAYRHTWSTGDGYGFAEACGHTITQLGPSLSSFLAHEQWVKDLSWIAFPNAAIRFDNAEMTDDIDHNGENFDDNKPVLVSGPLLCTHFWISGPVVFSLSAHVPYKQIDQTHPLAAQIVLEAWVSFETWDQRIVSWAKDYPARQLKTQLHTVFPERVVEKICEVVRIDPVQQLAHFTKEDRKRLVHALVDGLPLTLVARRPWDEFVTAWGVKLSEVDSKTMQSKILPWLYFAGEVLDVDGLTWWFNLTSSWATWWLAGKSILQN